MSAIENESPAGFGLKDARGGEPIRLAMQELRLMGHVLPVGARLMVRHAFRSAEARPLEMIYAFALPRDATLRRFRVSGKEFSIQSALKEVEEARQDYERGIEAGHLSTLAQVYRDGLVNLNVGNIQPGEDVLVWLELAAGVEARDDGFRLRFPFTLAPGYHAQGKSSIDEAGRGNMELPEAEFGDVILPNWSRDAQGLHRIGFDLTVGGMNRTAGTSGTETTHDFGEIASPSHPIRVTRLAAGRTRVELATEGDVPNRDLVLEARASETRKTKDAKDGRNSERAPLIFSGVDRGGVGRAAMLISSSIFGEAESAAQRIVFLLDRSGSMQGAPIAQARKSLAACLSVLEPGAQFGIVAFDNATEEFRPALADATDDVRGAARTFLDEIDARGGTELLAGIRAATALLGGAGGDIFILTDGQVSGTETIIAGAKAAGVRLHCLGIGSASQDRFLSLLARETGGQSRFLTPRERVDLAALELFGAVGRPVATGVTYFIADSTDGSDISDDTNASIEPPGPGVVFKGGAVTLFARRAAAAGEGKLIISWEKSAKVERREFSWRWNGEAGPLGETLKLLQGARLITDAEAQLDAPPPAASGPRAIGQRREDRGLRHLEALSREYNLASRAMALVAVLERASDKAGVTPETRVVGVGMPQDTAFGGYFAAPGAAGPAPMPVGAAAPMYTMASATGASSGGAFRKLCKSVALDDSTVASAARGGVLARLANAVRGRSGGKAGQSGAGGGSGSGPSAPPPMQPLRMDSFDAAAGAGDDDDTLAGSAPSIDDTLMELAALLRGDGGLPGGARDGDAERLLRTMAALVCFVAAGHRAGTGPFGRHVARMAEYLSKHAGAAPRAWGGAFDALRDRLIAWARNESGARPFAGDAGDWTELARRLILESRIGDEEAWRVMAALAK